MSDVVAYDPRELIASLAAEGVTVSVVRGRIRLKGPESLLGDAFARLDAYREAVVALLSDTDEALDDQPAVLECGSLAVPLSVLHAGELLVQAAAGERGIVLFETGAVTRLRYRDLLQEALALLAQWQDQGVRPGDPVLLCLGQMRSAVVCLWASLLGDLLPIPVSMGGGGTREDGPAVWRGIEAVRRSVWWVADYVSLRTAEYPIGRALASEVAELPKLPLGWQPSSQDSRRIALLLPDAGGHWVALSHREVLARATSWVSVLGLTGEDTVLNATALHRAGSLWHGHLGALMAGQEIFQVDEALVERDPIHWLRLIDELAITAAWAPESLWSRVQSRVEAQGLPPDLSFGLVRRLVFDLGSGTAVPRALEAALTAAELDPEATRRSWGVEQASALLMASGGGDVACVGVPVSEGGVRIVGTGDLPVMRGRRGWLQVRGMLLTRGDWSDSWRPVGWTTTGHVARLVDSGVIVLAWHPLPEAAPPQPELTLAATADIPTLALPEDAVSLPVAGDDAVPEEPGVEPIQLDVFSDAAPPPPAPIPAPVMEAPPAVSERPPLGATGGADVCTGATAQLAPRQSLYGRLQVLARQRPRDVAIRQDTQFVRYNALVQQVETWAASIRSMGVLALDRVVIAMPRGAEAVASWFALWRIGAVVVPIDIEEDDSFVRNVLIQVQPRLVLCHDSLMHGQNGERWQTLTEGVAPRAGLRDLPPAPLLRDESLPPNDQLACVFFHHEPDSVPVGVCFSHGDFLHQFQSMASLLALRANARWLATSPVSGAMGLFEGVMPLLAGATLVVPPGAVLTSERLVAPLRDHQITHVLLQPGWIPSLLEAGVLTRSLAVILTEPPTGQDLEALLATGVQGVVLTAHPLAAVCLSAQPLASVESGQVGEPLLNTGYAVMAADDSPVQGAGEGEWLVRGPGTMRHFWQRSDLDAARNRWCGGERYIRTGVSVSVEALDDADTVRLRRVLDPR